jgi:hypothetical protein
MSANSMMEQFHKRAHCGKQNCEYREAHELDGLSSPGVDEEEGSIVSRDKTSGRKNDVSHTDIL